MSVIHVMEITKDISFDVIHDVLHKAHSDNFNKRIVMHTTEMTPEELEAYIGSEGKCYVAMDDDKVVGTASFRIRTKHTWYVDGKFIDEVLVGVLPEYKGRHIYTQLYNNIEKYAIENGFSRIIFNTAARNKIKQKVSSKKGFQYVSYFVAEDNDHYSVVMAKWLDKCPYNKVEMWCRYHLKKWKVVLRYKPGKVKRFGF